MLSIGSHTQIFTERTKQDNSFSVLYTKNKRSLQQKAYQVLSNISLAVYFHVHVAQDCSTRVLTNYRAERVTCPVQNPKQSGFVCPQPCKLQISLATGISLHTFTALYKPLHASLIPSGGLLWNWQEVNTSHFTLL